MRFTPQSCLGHPWERWSDHLDHAEERRERLDGDRDERHVLLAGLAEELTDTPTVGELLAERGLKNAIGPIDALVEELAEGVRGA